MFFGVTGNFRRNDQLLRARSDTIRLRIECRISWCKNRGEKVVFFASVVLLLTPSLQGPFETSLLGPEATVMLVERRCGDLAPPWFFAGVQCFSPWPAAGHSAPPA